MIFLYLIVLTGSLYSSLKYLDISHCPKTYHSSVGLLRTVPRPFSLRFRDSSHVARPLGTVPRLFRPVPRPFSTVPRFFRTVPRLFGNVPRLFCTVPPKTFRYCPKTFRHCPKASWYCPKIFLHCPKTFPYCPQTSWYRPRTSSLQCWDTSHCPKTPSFLVLGQPDFLFFVVGTLEPLSLVPPLEL